MLILRTFIKKALLLGLFLILVGCASVPPNAENFSGLKLVKRWQTSIGTSVQNASVSPAYKIGNIYYVKNKSTVQAASFSSHKLLWQYKIAGKIYAGVSVGDNVLAVISTRAKLIVLSLNHGKLLWQTDISDLPTSKALIDKHAIFVKTIDGNVTAYDLQTGKTLWQYSHGSTGLSMQSDSGLALSHQKILTGFSDGALVALNKKTGQVIWQRAAGGFNGYNAMDRLVGVDSTPVVSGNRVFVVSYQGSVGAFQISTGKMFWKYPLSSETGIAADTDNIFVTDVDGNLWSFDKDLGGVNFKQSRFSGQGVTVPVVFMHRWIVMGTSQGLAFFKINTGQYIGTYAVASGIAITPIAIGSNILCVSTDGQLIVLSAS